MDSSAFSFSAAPAGEGECGAAIDALYMEQRRFIVYMIKLESLY